jgi:hypothetical protein
MKKLLCTAVLCVLSILNIQTVYANIIPIAIAGDDQDVYVDQVVSLDGSASYDPDGVSIFWSWMFVSVPAGSIAALSDPNSPAPSFIPDVAGDYDLELIVNDGFDDSAPDFVTISATVVPVPPAVWLFGSGLLGLVGIARRRKQPKQDSKKDSNQNNSRLYNNQDNRKPRVTH